MESLSKQTLYIIMEIGEWLNENNISHHEVHDVHSPNTAKPPNTTKPPGAEYESIQLASEAF